MKKIITTTLALTLALGLSACHPSEDNSESRAERTMRLSIECIQAGGTPQAVGEPGAWNNAEYFCAKE